MPWRLLKWVVLTLALGAFPYLFAAALLHLEEPARSAFPSSPEILFLALSASAAALADLLDDGVPPRGGFVDPPQPSRRFVAFVMGVCVVAAGILYGAFVHHGLHAPGRPAGVDCAAVAEAITMGRSEWLHPSDEFLRTWGTPCRRWARVQDAFFRWSTWMTVALAAVSTAVVLWFPARR